MECAGAPDKFRVVAVMIGGTFVRITHTQTRTHMNAHTHTYTHTRTHTHTKAHTHTYRVTARTYTRVAAGRRSRL